jgi:DNA-binding response OmpR family regulator
MRSGGDLLISDAPAEQSIAFFGEWTKERTALARSLGSEGFLVVTGSRDSRMLAEGRVGTVLAVDANFGRLKRLCADLRAAEYRGPLLAILEHAMPGEATAVVDAGADDCLVPPIDLPFLAARLSALFRRLDSSFSRVDAPVQLVAADRAAALCLFGRKIALTPIESRILSALVSAAGAIVSLHDLRRIASPEAPLSPACLSVHVAKVRRKLGPE